LIVSNTPEAFAQWKPIPNCEIASLDIGRLTTRDSTAGSPQGHFDACVVFLWNEEDGTSPAPERFSLEHLRPLMKSHARALIVTTADTRNHLALVSLDRAIRALSLTDTADWSMETRFIRAGWLRQWAQRLIVNTARATRQHGLLYLLTAVLLLPLLLPVSLLCNLLALARAKWPPPDGNCSSVMIILGTPGCLEPAKIKGAALCVQRKVRGYLARALNRIGAHQRDGPVQHA